MADRALVLNVQRMSTEDGPGIRTTVFFKGCPLRCSWCHNPESLSDQVQIVWHPDRCIGCHRCLSVCREGALQADPKGIGRDRTRCTACARCVEECPAGAMERLGTPWEVDPLVARVLKDRSYYRQSGGGVTVSGGEPTRWPSFVEAFLGKVRAAGVHTALDTCGLCAPAVLDRVAARADLVLYDLKLLDDDAHRRYTGHPAHTIRANLLRLVVPVLWVRTPLIPGITATEENIRSIGRFLAQDVDVARWELCAFNNLCAHKYERLDLPWALAGTPLLRASDLARLEAVARDCGLAPDRIHVSGRTRPDEEAS